MYLDDGVSKDSAPYNLPQYKYQDPSKAKKAKGYYKEVKMTQVCIPSLSVPAPLTRFQESTSASRTVTICHPWDGYDAKSTVGDRYNLAVWTVKADGSAPQVQVSFEDETGKTISDPGLLYGYDGDRGVLTVNVPVALVPSLDHPASINGTTTKGLTNGFTNGVSADGRVKDRYIAVKISGLF